jgi:hypothetical protein
MSFDNDASLRCVLAAKPLSPSSSPFTNRHWWGGVERPQSRCFKLTRTGTWGTIAPSKREKNYEKAEEQHKRIRGLEKVAKKGRSMAWSTAVCGSFQGQGYHIGETGSGHSCQDFFNRRIDNASQSLLVQKRILILSRLSVRMLRTVFCPHRGQTLPFPEPTPFGEPSHPTARQLGFWHS